MSESNSSIEVEYRQIPGFPDYRVGSDGTVWSCKERTGKHSYRHGNNWRRLTGCVSNGTHYRTATLRHNGNAKQFWIHQLVLLAFVGPPPRDYECRHLNSDRLDNRLCNLAWGTVKENADDRNIAGTQLRGDACPTRTLSEAMVIELRRRRALGETIGQMMREFGLNRSTVSRALCGRCWAHVHGALPAALRPGWGSDGKTQRDLTDRRFGRWIVLGRGPRGKQRQVYWICRCSCGVERLVAEQSLISGRSTGCKQSCPKGIFGDSKAAVNAEIEKALV